jgi:diguanylate cyclase (GGDEF)-like protein
MSGTEVKRHVHERGVGARIESCNERHRVIRQQREPVLDDDVRDTDCPDVRSRMLVPLVLHGEPMGVLQADSDDADAFGTDELRLLDAIGGQAATAIENARLYALANVDGLTGLYCRRYLDVRLAEEIERGRRFGTSFALVLLDLDDFKHLNDTLGHLAGDRALREISAIAASQLRGVDLAARFGGEELAFLLPRTSLADAHAVAERIREAVALHCFSEAGRMIHITASLGVAGWAESGGGDVATLVQRADTALYRAKRAGKNRVEIDLQNFELTPSLAPVIRRRVS